MATDAQIPDAFNGCKRILVCGGRNYDDRDLVYGVLDHCLREGEVDAIVQGGASGADCLARDWARSRHIFCMNYPADWKRHGKAAGPIRNQQMIDESGATMVLAFSGGRGTRDMMRRAEAAGLPVAWYTETRMT